MASKRRATGFYGKRRGIVAGQGETENDPIPPFIIHAVSVNAPPAKKIPVPVLRQSKPLHL